MLSSSILSSSTVVFIRENVYSKLKQILPRDVSQQCVLPSQSRIWVLAVATANSSGEITQHRPAAS